MLINTETRAYDLSLYPKIYQGNRELVFPTLNSNVLLLTYLLIQYDVIHLSEAQYAWLITLYQAPPESLTKQNLHDFDQMIDNLSISQYKKITFLGGLLAGAGQNDYFMLKLLDRLQEKRPGERNSCQYDILLTRSDLDFLLQYEAQNKEIATYSLSPLSDTDHPANSFKAMTQLLKKGLITPLPLNQLIQKALSSHIKIFSYTPHAEEKKSITLLGTHPFDFETLSAIQNELGLQKKTTVTTALEARQRIDQINKRITTLLADNTLPNFINNILSQCARTEQHSPLLLFLTPSTPTKPLNSLESFNNGIDCQAVFNEPYSLDTSQHVDELSLRPKTITTGEIKIGVLTDRFLFYCLKYDNNNTKYIHIHYMIQMGKFLTKTKLVFEIPQGITDEEAIRRLRLIYSEGRPDQFFNEITDSTARVAIEKELDNIRYRTTQYLAPFRYFTPTRGVEDFFKHCPSSELAPLNEDEITKGERNSVPNTKGNIDITIQHIKKGLEIKTRYRYSPEQTLSIQEIDRRLARAFSDTHYPYQALFTLFGQHYDPRTEKPIQAIMSFFSDTTSTNLSTKDSFQQSDYRSKPTEHEKIRTTRYAYV